MFFKTFLVVFIVLIVCTSASRAINGFSVQLMKHDDMRPLKTDVGSSNFHKRQAHPLFEVDHGRTWAGNINVGGLTFLVEFDTGSSDFWIISKDCDSEFCQRHHQYNTGSGSGKLQEGTFQIEYLDDSIASGPIYTDTVTIGGVSVNNQVFSAVTELTGQFTASSVDGLFGLGPTRGSHLEQPTFFENAAAQGTLQKAEFSMYLADQGSELFFGGSNPNLYTGDFESHSVDSKAEEWLIRGAAISVGGTRIISDFVSIIDSGTTRVNGPYDAVQRLYDAIAGSSGVPESPGRYHFPCGSAKYLPLVSFNWGGKDWAIPAENFNVRPSEGYPSMCIGSIIGRDLPDSKWVIGDAFMKSVYTRFSLADMTVSFAALKH